MKVKSDFVTNSSSSSFVVWGVSLDKIKFSSDALLRVFEEKLEYARKRVSDGDGDKWGGYYKETASKMSAIETDEKKIEWIEEHADFDEKMSGLVGFSWNDNDYVRAIGVSPNDAVKKYSDVPAGKIKDAVAKDLNEKFGTNFSESDIEYFQEGWYDG